MIHVKAFAHVVGTEPGGIDDIKRHPQGKVRGQTNRRKYIAQGESPWGLGSFVVIMDEPNKTTNA
jgi:hypothetical protein